MGGRGSRSRMASSGSSLNNSIDAFKQARSERQRLAQATAPSQRTNQQHEAISRAMERENAAANNMVTQASDADFDAGAKKYFDDLGSEEGARTQERIINTLARTNKNGSTSATATRTAEGYGDWVAQNVGNKLANTGAFHVNETNNRRGAEALIREARRRKGR